jgi:hypothetical protein
MHSITPFFDSPQMFGIAYLWLALLASLVSASTLTESLFRFDSALHAYISMSEGPSNFAFVFPDLAGLTKASNQAQETLSKKTLDSFQRRIDTTTQEIISYLGNRESAISYSDRFHIVAAIASALIDPLKTETADKKMSVAMQSLDELEGAGYAGLFFRSQDDSDEEDASPKRARQRTTLRDLPWMQLSKYLEYARERGNEYICELIQLSLKASFGGSVLATEFANLVESVITFDKNGRAQSLEFLYMRTDMKLLTSASLWTDLDEDIVTRATEAIDRLMLLIQAAEVLDSASQLDATSSTGFTRPIIGADMMSPQFRFKVYDLPSNILKKYVDVLSLVPATEGWIVQLLAVNRAIEREFKSAWSVKDRLDRILNRDPALVPLDIIQKAISPGRDILTTEYKTAIFNTAVCIEMAGPGYESQDLNESLARLVMCESSLDHRTFVISCLMPAISVIEDFLQSL